MSGASNVSFPTNFCKSAYLGTAAGVLMSAATKDGNMVEGAKYGLIAGVAIYALARLFELNSSFKIQLDSKEITQAYTDCLDQTVRSSIVGLALAPTRGDISMNTAVRGIGIGAGIVAAGECAVLVASKVLDTTSSRIQPPAEPKELSIEHLKNLGLRGMEKHLEDLQRLLYSRRPGFSEELAERGVKPIKGLLLYGPPGTGKTSLARNLGDMLGCTKEQIIFTSGPALKKRFFGESEESVRKLFEPAKKNQEKYGKQSPLHVVVIDEIDAVISKREVAITNAVGSICEQFLTCLDGLESIDNVVVIGITNVYKQLDEAAVRPGRFDVHLEISNPDAAGRKEIFEHYLGKIAKYLGQDINIDELVAMTPGFSGAKIEGLINTANGTAFLRSVKNRGDLSAGKTTMADLKNALQKLKENDDTFESPEGMYM